MYRVGGVGGWRLSSRSPTPGGSRRPVAQPLGRALARHGTHSVERHDAVKSRPNFLVGASGSTGAGDAAGVASRPKQVQLTFERWAGNSVISAPITASVFSSCIVPTRGECSAKGARSAADATPLPGTRQFVCSHARSLSTAAFEVSRRASDAPPRVTPRRARSTLSAAARVRAPGG